jgi:hypothetical protein
MTRYMLSHRHLPEECRTAFAAWHGFDSPLRHQPALASCEQGGHELWWTVESAGAEAALALLPAFVADRTEVNEVREVPIP